MNPKQFLVIGGLILVVIGVLGMIKIIGPTPSDSIFGSHWYFTPAENWAHLILGIVGLIAAFVFPASINKPLVMLLGIVGLLVAGYNIFSMTLGSAHLERPADLVLHLVVGLWALWASMGKQTSLAPVVQRSNNNMPGGM